jgi:hypothetical protein
MSTKLVVGIYIYIYTSSYMRVCSNEIAKSSNEISDACSWPPLASSRDIHLHDLQTLSYDTFGILTARGPPNYTEGQQRRT